MNKFHGDQPWSRITTLAKRSARTRVAVPYLQGEANRMLPLKAADVLKVNIMSRQVNPDELRAYRRKGVKLYTAPNLHAKVFVFGKTAIIGSTNVSSSSETRLREAVVETTDPRVVASAGKFIEDLESEPVTDSWLRLCDQIYKPPSGFGGGGASQKPQDADRWCRKVMRLVAPGAVTHDGLNRYYISLKSAAVARASLRVDRNDEGQAIFLLSLHPADTPSQAKAFYPSSDEKAIVRLKQKGWEVYPNFHFGFGPGGLCWIDAPMGIRQYIRFWKRNVLPIETVHKDKSRFLLFFRRLRKLKLISSSDIPTLEENFTRTKRKSLQVRPGVTLQFAWPHNGKLPDAARFATQVRTRINEALRTCAQPTI